jgi:hypothetical protein
MLHMPIIAGQAGAAGIMTSGALRHDRAPSQCAGRLGTRLGSLGCNFGCFEPASEKGRSLPDMPLSDYFSQLHGQFTLHVAAQLTGHFTLHFTGQFTLYGTVYTAVYRAVYTAVYRAVHTTVYGTAPAAPGRASESRSTRTGKPIALVRPQGSLQDEAVPPCKMHASESRSTHRPGCTSRHRLQHRHARWQHTCLCCSRLGGVYGHMQPASRRPAHWVRSAAYGRIRLRV